MTRIERSIEILASSDRVWDIISDLDKEGDYWYGTKAVHNTSRNGNEVDREIVQAFRNQSTKQKVILRPKDSIEFRFLKGRTEGVKIISIEKISESTQRVKVFWDVHFNGWHRLATPIIAYHVGRGTTHALMRTKTAAEIVPAK